MCFAGKVYITPCEWLSRCREAVLFFTVSEDDVILADKFYERSYNDKIHLLKWCLHRVLPDIAYSMRRSKIGAVFTIDWVFQQNGYGAQIRAMFAKP